jgi:hypothetical protein
MVRTCFIAVVVLAHAGVAIAHPPPEPDRDIDRGDVGYEMPIQADEDDSPAFNMFGMHMAIGALPIDGARTLAMSLGLGIEHPVFKKTRVAFEYDWLWLSQTEDSMRDRDADAIRPEHHGSGHRVGLSLRRELKAKDGRMLRLFIDGEAGATVALVNDSMDGPTVIPGGFLGLRTGYDLYSKRDDSPSRTFETALLVRAHVVSGGVGFSFGFGMFWGN